MSSDDDTRSASPGMLSSAAGIAKNALALLLARLELAGIELADARDALFGLLLLTGCGLLAAGFALAFWTALIVVLTWEVMGWSILLLFGVAYTVLAWWFLHRVQTAIRQGKLGLPETMTELKRDREALFD